MAGLVLPLPAASGRMEKEALKIYMFTEDD